MNGFLTDLRFAIRQLGVKPGFAAAAILTLALGIGACTAVFSLLNGYLLKPLPYPYSEQLVEIRQMYPKIGVTAGTSVPLYEDILKHAPAFSGGALYGSRSFTVQAHDHTRLVSGGAVTPSFFGLLGARPLVGRVFSQSATQPGHGKVAVLSYSLWQRLFDGAPDIVGKSVRMKGSPYRIIGVMPQSFVFPDRGTEMWVPMTISAADRAPEQLGSTSAFMIARRNPAVDAATARRELHQILAAAGKKVMAVTATAGHHGKSQVASGFLTVEMTSLHKDLMGDRTETLLLLQLAALLLLLITCANVANLLLVRILGRTHEIAMRAAVGASRRRLARQLLTEAFCLALPGGALGAAFGWWLLTLFAQSSFGPGQSVFTLAPDWRVAAFIVAIVILTAIVVSVLPLWRLSRLQLHSLLSSGGHIASDSRRSARVRQALVVIQLALVTILLAGSGLLAHSLLRVNAVNPGYDISELLTGHVTVPPSDPHSEHLATFYSGLAEHLGRLPGVEAVGITSSTPFSQGTHLSGFAILGEPPRQRQNIVEATIQAANPGFFHALQISLLRGRMFDARDTRDGQLVVLIDEEFAKRFFSDGNPIGRQIRLGSETPWRTVIGVVPTVRLQSLTSPIEHGVIYAPVGQYLAMRYSEHDLGFTIETSVPPAALIPAVRQAVHGFDSAVALDGLEPLTETVSGLLQSRQATATLVMAFGGIALLLAAIGIYAMLSYSIRRQTAAFGVRLALGALPEDVLWLVLKDGLKLLAFALVIGLGLAVLLGYLMSAQLFEVAPFDPLTLTGSAVVLCAITLAACYLPARRAARLDPTEALQG